MILEMDDTWTGSCLCPTAKRAVRDFSIVADEDAVVLGFAGASPEGPASPGSAKAGP